MIIMCTQFGLLVEVVKMTASMFVVTVLLLSVSEVIVNVHLPQVRHWMCIMTTV